MLFQCIFLRTTVVSEPRNTYHPLVVHHRLLTVAWKRKTQPQNKKQTLNREKKFTKAEVTL